MNDMITVRGFVATKPPLRQTLKNTPVTHFRLASTARRYNSDKGSWEDAGGTNWYTVNCYRVLADNVVASIQVGDPVVVYGRLKIREWNDASGHKRHNVEIDASSVGPDLALGVAYYSRSSSGQDRKDQHPNLPAHHETEGQSMISGVEPVPGEIVDLHSESSVEYHHNVHPEPVSTAAG